ncbi:hypothetical protein MTR67_008192 [Solanum verrucosum]|uniref:Uncharacterized protein n=1 Tax=Solanum verrucosum TaxID=315347 RepID=A0AAF0Q1P1_SOLVR|nr:hypothetical protein MTR67_008192 [Solanum verrucosum]
MSNQNSHFNLQVQNQNKLIMYLVFLIIHSLEEQILTVQEWRI